VGTGIFPVDSPVALFSAFEPDQTPDGLLEAVQEVALEDVQVRLAEVLYPIVIGPSELLAFKSTRGKFGL